MAKSCFHKGKKIFFTFLDGVNRFNKIPSNEKRKITDAARPPATSGLVLIALTGSSTNTLVNSFTCICKYLRGSSVNEICFYYML